MYCLPGNAADPYTEPEPEPEPESEPEPEPEPFREPGEVGDRRRHGGVQWHLARSRAPQ